MLTPLMEVNEAERRGDARAALDIIEARPTGSDGKAFWNPARVARLLQLEMLAPVLPRWATSRWILEQALLQLDPALRDRHLRASEIAVELRGGAALLPGKDELDAMAKVIDHDWVYRQLMLHEYGGLATFLRRGASPDLVAGADQIHAWAAAPMRALRFEDRCAGTLLWTDLTSGEQVEVIDLGAAAMVLPGECVLGRLVPTGDGPMFEGVPLLVSASTATAVGDDPAGWLGALRQGADDDEFQPSVVHGNFLLTDVPGPLSVLAVVPFLPGRRRGDLTGEDLTEAVLGLARASVSGELAVEPDGLDPWACLAAELLAPGVLQQLPDRLDAADGDLLEALADRLVGPAAAVCRELAELVTDRAA